MDNNPNLASNVVPVSSQVAANVVPVSSQVAANVVPVSSQVAANVVPVSSQITYAPYVAPETANLRLVCVAIVWQDNPGADLDSVSNCGKSTADTFKKLSNGAYIFESSAYRISVPYDRKTQNVAPAVDYAKKALAAKGIQGADVRYAMVNELAQAFSHSAGVTSNILNALATTFYHEIGRLNNTNLGSSAAIKDGKKEDQADGTTFMGHFASDELTASQQYELGWLANTQVALYNDPTATVEYTIVPLDATDSTSLKAVLLPDVANRPLFFSRPTFKNTAVLNALHLAEDGNNRGSVRVGVFGKAMNYQGVTFDIISEDGGTATVRIGPQVAAPKVQAS